MPLISEVGRKKTRIRLLIIFITAVLWLGILLHLFPVWWMITTSMKNAYEVFEFPPPIWPREPNFITYRLLIRLLPASSASRHLEKFASQGMGDFQYPIYVYIKNSFIMTGLTMLIQVPITALIAYAISKLYAPLWARIVFLLCIGVMMVPRELSIVPSYLIMSFFPFPGRNIPTIPFTGIRFPTHNFIDSYWAVILPMTYSGFSVLLFKGFFDTIPESLIHAARLDGASELSIFRRIVLPMSKPVFAVVAYFTFSASWNDFLWPLIVIRNNKLFPIPVILYKVQEMLTWEGLASEATDEMTRKLIESGIGYNGLMTIAIFQSIPVFIMFIIFREQLLKGIQLRGFK